MCWLDLGTEVAVLNSQVVPIYQVVLKTGFTVNVKDYYDVYIGLIQGHVEWRREKDVHLYVILIGELIKVLNNL